MTDEQLLPRLIGLTRESLDGGPPFWSDCWHTAACAMATLYAARRNPETSLPDFLHALAAEPDFAAHIEWILSIARSKA
jgi:hypothetical protein